MEKNLAYRTALSSKTHLVRATHKTGWFAEPDNICNHESPISRPAAGSIRYDDTLLAFLAAQLALKLAKTN